MSLDCQLGPPSTKKSHQPAHFIFVSHGSIKEVSKASESHCTRILVIQVGTCWTGVRLKDFPSVKQVQAKKTFGEQAYPSEYMCQG
jgi:hypothetical protein